MHSHSWAFALKIIEGGYEMGLGFSASQDIAPEAILTICLQAGDMYEMTSSDVWHYTKCIEHVESWSVMLVGPRWRKRKSVNNELLNEMEQAEMFNYFGGI